MNFIFPMGGLSSRFTDAGYTVPKYRLELHGATVFEHAVIGFHRYFSAHNFVFAYRGEEETERFITEKCHSMGIPSKNLRLVRLEDVTSGQAETVCLAIEGAGIGAFEPITIFNIDSFESDFNFPSDFDIENVDGYLEVFIAEGNHWSFVEPGQKGRVVRVTEKDRISEYCSSGLYYFKKSIEFMNGYKHTYDKISKGSTETESYIAPIYNFLISQGADIRYNLVKSDEVAFCGVPDEYLSLISRNDLPTAILLKSYLTHPERQVKGIGIPH